MPIFEIEHGNRTYEVDSPTEPTPEDVDAILSSVPRGASGEWGSNPFALNEAEFRAASPMGRLKMMLSHPWEKYAASVDQAFKGPNIPRVEADKGTDLVSRAGQVGAALDNTVAGAAGGLVTPGTAAAVVSPLTLVYAAPRFIQSGLSSIGQAAKGEGNLQQTIEEALGGGLSVAGGVLGGLHGAKGGLPVRTPREAASILEQAAEKSDAPGQKKILLEAAKKVEEIPRDQPIHGFTPEEITQEIAKTPDDKIASLRQQISRGDEVDYQYSVWDKEMLPEGADRALQIDIVPKDANEANVGGLGSTNRKVLAGLGVELPPVPDWVPSGSYTRADIEALIKQGPPKAGEELVYVPKEEPAISAKDAVPEASVSGPEVGLGAASPREFQPVGEFVTSMKNEVVDKERVERGLPPAMQEAAKSMGDSWNEAMKLIDEDQNIADRLISELKEKTRPINDVENSILLHRKIDLENQFDRLSKNIDENIGTEQSIAQNRIDKERVFDELLDLEQVGRSGGTELGRGLNARKLMAAEDFSLVKMVAKRQAAVGDRKLTPTERAEVEQIHKEITEFEKDLLDTKSPEEYNRVQAKRDIARQDFNDLLEGDKFKRLTAIQKIRQRGWDLWDASRNIMTSGEFSVLLRQGGFSFFSDPINWAKAIPKAIKAFGEDSVGARALDLEVFNHVDAPAALEAGLSLAEEGAKLSKQDEIIMSRLGEKLPGLRNFNQFSRVYLNKLRFDLWKNMREMGDITPARDKQIAMFVNESTGRGGLGKFESSAVALNRIFFSPRFWASRVQMMVGHSMWGGDLHTRMIIARQYVKALTGLAAFYAAAKIYGELGDRDEAHKVKITFDLRTSDAGKVQIGKTRLDPLAGVASSIVYGARTALAGYNFVAREAGAETIPEKVDTIGRKSYISGPKVPFKGDRWSDITARYVRSKLAPVPSIVSNLFDGTDLAGNEATLLNQSENVIAPLTYRDIYQAFKEQDVDDATAFSLLAMLGMGLQTYGPRKKATQPKPVPSTKEVSLPSGTKAKVRKQE